ncbi:MAG: HAD hydrolase-like protein [Anaerolineaceae bacterium]|nr:HAD hydrolase-like protein [Anaerolineaceae bacterium]
MSLQGIIFDLDGTLANTLPFCVRAYQLTTEHFTGHFPTENDVTSLFGPADEGVLEILVPGRLSESLPYYLNLYEQLHLIDCKKPFPGVEKALTLLQTKGIRTAIVTAKGPHTAAISLRILGLDRWIDIMETGFSDRVDKPLSIRKVLERWRLKPEQVAYVGDTPYDIGASVEAGLLPIGAAWASTSTLPKEGHPQAYKIFTDIDSFIDWIEIGEESKIYCADDL